MNNKYLVLLYQALFIIGFIALWELFAQLNILNTFLFSSPSSIIKLILDYSKNGELLRHINISVFETLLGLIIGTTLGLVTAILLWFSPSFTKIFDPILVMLNALPKTALAPILIIWAGTNIKGIILNNFDNNNFMHRDNLKQNEALTKVKVIATVEKNANDIRNLANFFEEI